MKKSPEVIKTGNLKKMQSINEKKSIIESKPIKLYNKLIRRYSMKKLLLALIALFVMSASSFALDEIDVNNV